MKEKVENYVRENYKKLYGDKPLFIVEREAVVLVSTNVDESPLVLNKSLF